MEISRSRIAAAILVVGIVGATGVVLVGGGRVTTVLSRVGAAVGGPGEALAPAAQGDTTSKGAGGSSGSSSGGSTGSTGSNGSVPLYDVSRPDLLVIRTGTLELQVATLDDALASASSAIAGLGGHASGSDRSGDGEAAHASVTYRIPVASWDQALTALRRLAVKVVAEQSRSEDVTTQVVDLSARIANLQATERALQAIMARADKIADVLAVQEQLTTVRGQIEQATAERKHLQDQAAFSTLTVGFGLRPDPVVTAQRGFDPRSEVDRAAASLVEVIQGVATAGIWFGIVWLPILLVLGIIGGVLTLVGRRVARSLPPRDGGQRGLVPSGTDAPAA